MRLRESPSEQIGQSVQIVGWWAVGMGAVVSLISPVALRPVLERHGIVDRPNERSSHLDPTLRAGGIAQLAGLALACTVLSTAMDGVPRSVILVIAITGILASLLGLAEDVYGLSVVARAMGQLLVGIVVSSLLGLVLGAHWWQVVGGAIAVMTYVNVANFMDGVNGISGMHGLLVGGTYALFGLLAQTSWLTDLGLVVAATFAVFLPWNLRKPGIFLGDVGSYLLGASIASIAVAASFAGFSPVVVLAPVAVYLADTSSTIIRRVLREEPVLRSHRAHSYQRLTDTGLSHVQVATIVTLFSLATSTLGVLVLHGSLTSWLAVPLIAAICAVYLALPRARGNRLGPRPASRLEPFALPDRIPPRPGFAPTRWAVLGASGFVGSALVAHLEASGHEVKAIRAPRLTLGPAAGSAETVAGIAADHGVLAELTARLQDVDVVVNSAGLATPDSPPSDELYGANALLPPLVCLAAQRAGAARVIHLSSAAVQGHRPVLDETIDAVPFSPYSRSKALGERAFLAAGRTARAMDAVVIRATSVQGHGRRTTASLRRISRSPLASVAGNGDQPTVVSSIDGLTDFVTRVSVGNGALSPIMIQPWEGLSVGDVLRLAGGSEPRHLPSWVCRVVLACVGQVGRVVPELAGAGRRLEMMWMGQRQTSGHETEFPPVPRERLESILAASDVVA